MPLAWHVTQQNKFGSSSPCLSACAQARLKLRQKCIPRHLLRQPSQQFLKVQCSSDSITDGGTFNVVTIYGLGSTSRCFTCWWSWRNVPRHEHRFARNPRVHAKKFPFIRSHESTSGEMRCHPRLASSILQRISCLCPSGMPTMIIPSEVVIKYSDTCRLPEPSPLWLQLIMPSRIRGVKEAVFACLRGLFNVILCAISSYYIM